MTTFHDFLLGRLEKGGFTAEDALTAFLPLVRQVAASHNAGLVAPLEGVEDLEVDGPRIFYHKDRTRPPSVQTGKLRELEKARKRAVDVVGESRITLEVEKGHETFVSLELGKRGEEITRPVYLPGYVSWEHELGHHDPITDTFSLGMIFASLLCGLDLDNPEQLALFVNHRRNLFHFNQHLHPVLAKAATRMTELDRHRRPQQLSSLLHTLENYRDQDIDLEYELARNPGFRETDVSGKRRTILTALQQRLFEISRRNRLLHFRQTMQTVNLSVASVPLSFDPNSIRSEQIVTWNAELRDSVVAGKAIQLNKHLRFEEAVYLPGLLDHIRTEAQRDQVEFGFAQLRLALCFLRWSNLKEKPPERFDSPFILLPIKLVKKKGVRDTYSLEVLSTEAEINPVLRFYFKQLYDVSLPEALDLTSTSLDAFHESLAAKIQLSEPAVSVIKIDRPRIHLIHAKARRRLDQYIQRTRLSGRGIRTYQDLDYSYAKENFHPLGLRLFQTKIRRPETNLETIVQRAPSPRNFILPESQTDTPVSEQERELYSLSMPEEANPYTWEYDLCSVTLGNFRYRKMSLVRDYTALLENHADNPAFDAVFSVQPRSVDPTAIELPPLEDRFPVLTCDPTQTWAITQARDGKNYIIQGPPGTGKSQTIANLIADYVTRGLSVLFVCEKRAALDVVYHRLRQTGLHALCALIHDSQEDKKEFIMDLKQVYESYVANAGTADAAALRQRQGLLRALERDVQPLQAFHEAMRRPPAGASVPLREILQRLVALHDSLPELTDVEKERIPHYGQWCEHRERIERLTSNLKELNGDPIFARHPLRNLTTRLAGEERPLEKTLSHLGQARKLLQDLEKELRDAGLRAGEYDKLEKSHGVIRYAEQVRFLAEKRLLSLLDADSGSSKKFADLVKSHRRRAKELEEARQVTRGWQQKLSPSELKTALEQASAFEKSPWSFLKPAWWKLRSTLRRCYDFGSERIKPAWTRILRELAAEYRAQRAMEELESKAQRTFDFNGPIHEFIGTVRELRKAVEQLSPELKTLHRRLLASIGADATLVRLAGLEQQVEQLTAELAGFLADYNGRTFVELAHEMDSIEESLDQLPGFLPCLAELAGMRSELADVLRRLPLATDELEAAMAGRTWGEACRTDRTLQRFTAQLRSRHLRQLRRTHDQLYAVNAAVVRERVEQRFLDHLRISGSPHAQLTNDQKEFKTKYSRGRRELEHEFGKSMRYRSIRDLVAGDSGSVIRDLKPVWLMSPLSVSDTLPLDAAHFDVVIFDEASQVTLEEAVPSLFRAAQVIVVGDQMQLPPTNFFSAKHIDEEEMLLLADEASGEEVEYDLEGNSLLAHAARVLPSTMLGWHYRSRSESLISFSNAAFYHGRLLTVPEKTLPSAEWSEIRVADSDQAVAGAEALLWRPISFHFLEHGVYSNRRNSAEADYIARLVRELLGREKRPSIGIVAFSEAQQGEVQHALQRLGEEDAAFGDRLEAEWEREENGQFTGLLVKNLENIQGDERDVVILSVCYGRAPSGKMLMNFGPINQSGGEKRLNVAFSRAKVHMVVVSSIRYSEITNDYNDGARCLKSYLRYAQAASIGDRDAAGRTLREMLAGGSPAFTAETSEDAVVDQLKSELRKHGYEADLNVGQSNFRCDLAVRRPGERTYRAAILVDTAAYYRQNDTLERDVMRPLLLEGAGWRTTHVLAKDWFSSRANTLKSVLRFIEEESDTPGGEKLPRECAGAAVADAQSPSAVRDA